MADYSFDKILTAEQAALVFDRAHADSLLGIFRALGIKEGVLEMLPRSPPIPSRAVVFGESVYANAGDQEDQVAALRRYMEKEGILDLARDLDASPSEAGPKPEPLGEADRISLASRLQKDGALVISTRSETPLLLLSYHDYIISAHDYVEMITGIKNPSFAIKNEGALNAMHNIILITRTRVQAVAQAYADTPLLAVRFREADPRLIRDMLIRIAGMEKTGRETWFGQNFRKTILECREAIGDEAPQLLVDAYVYGAFASKRGIGEIGGMIEAVDAAAFESCLEALKVSGFPDLLSDPYKAVPFIFDFFDGALPDSRMPPVLLEGLNRILARKMDDESSIRFLRAHADHRKLKFALPFALFMRYLEAVRALMPTEFSQMAPVRGQDTDKRLAAMKIMLSKAIGPEPGSSFTH